MTTKKIVKSLPYRYYKTKKHTTDLKRVKWSELYDIAQPLYEMANKRYNELRNEGYFSSAMEKAKRATKTDGFGKFGKKPTKFELARDIYAARAFLADAASTKEGAESEQRLLHTAQYEGAFGKGWYEIYGVSYDKSRIDPEFAKMAFSIFRELEKREANLLYFKNGIYDSERVMREIYDYVEENYTPTDSERDISEFRTQAYRHFLDVIETEERLADPTKNITYTRDFIHSQILTGGLFK